MNSYFFILYFWLMLLIHNKTENNGKFRGIIAHHCAVIW